VQEPHAGKSRAAPLGMTDLPNSGNPGESSRGGLCRASEGFDHGVENHEAVGGVEGGLHGAFGMGHEAGDVAFTIADAGDIGHGAVGITGGVIGAVGRGVAKKDLMIFFEVGEGVGVASVVAVVMSDRDAEDLALGCGGGKGRIGFLDANVNVAADIAEARVAHHGAWKQARFQEDLKAVADAEDGAAGFREFRDGVHDRREAGDGAGAEVVSVSEAAGEDDGIAILDIFGLVPDKFDGLAEDRAEGVESVVIAVGPGEDNDSEFQGAPPGSGSERFILAQREGT